jgi:effector-binding domain-containing protein
MANKNFAAILLFLLFAILCCWFFLLEKGAYTTSFTTSSAPGVVYEKVLNWKFRKFQEVEIVEKMPFYNIRQKLDFRKDSTFLDWSFIPLNDSITQVELKAISANPSFENRLKMLFKNDKLEEGLETELAQLQETLISDKELYSVQVNGETTSPASNCACISLNSKTDGKAFKMMASIDHLSDFVLENNLETTGRPRVIIQKWNIKKDSIAFDFCFPVLAEKQPQHPLIFFRNIPAVLSLKATFRGNYMFSHLAWYELLNYAERNGYEVQPLPQEIFYDNPELGGDSRNWKAEIFFPLKQ